MLSCKLQGGQQLLPAHYTLLQARPTDQPTTGQRLGNCEPFLSYNLLTSTVSRSHRKLTNSQGVLILIIPIFYPIQEPLCQLRLKSSLSPIMQIFS